MPLTGFLLAATAGVGQTFNGTSSAGTNAPLAVQSDGTLRLDNRPFTGLGVNYFDGFNRVLWHSANTNYEAGFQYLAQRGISFARVDISGYRPAYTNLFFSDRAEYFRRLDAFVASAERHGIGLILTFFWTTYGFSDLAGENLDQIAVQTSATRQKMREFTTEIVNRYKDSRAIWAWEFGNEWNLAVDLPNATEFLPPTNAAWGNPPTRDPVRDILSTGIIMPAMQEFADLVKLLDPGRPISTGHAMPRSSAWNQDRWKRGLQSIDLAWSTDTDAQAREIALRQCPAPFNLLSIHVYSTSEDVPRIARYAQVAREAGIALFAGEFGVNTSVSLDPQSDYNQLLEACRVAPLVAMWAYDRALESMNSPRIVAGPDFGNASRVVSNGGKTNAPAVATGGPVAIGPGASATGVLSFDILRAGASTSLEGFGLGNGTNGVSFPNSGTQFYFRPVLTGGTMTRLTQLNGNSFGIPQNKWYRLTATLDFAANTITSVFVKNLTDNTADQQLYFGAGNATFPYVLDETAWNVATVRAGLSTNPVTYLDNLKFETRSSGGVPTQVYAEDFEATPVGALGGQGGWVAGISSDPWYASKSLRTWMLDALFPPTFGIWSRGWGPNEVAGPDGMNVAAQYIFGSPRPGIAAPPVAGQSSTNSMSLEAVVRTNDPSWRIFGETSSALSAGGWTTNEVSWQSSINQSGVLPGAERRVFTVPAGTNTAKFLRIKAQTP